MDYSELQILRDYQVNLRFEVYRIRNIILCYNVNHNPVTFSYEAKHKRAIKNTCMICVKTYNPNSLGNLD